LNPIPRGAVTLIYAIGKITDGDGEVARIIPVQDHIEIIVDQETRAVTAAWLQ
jgi:hypothetical protein